jgi:hypothetical protein
MQWIIDNLAAFLIGTTILLILFVLQSRGQEAAMEALQFNTAKTDIHAAVAMLEQDLANAGAGLLVPSSGDPLVGVGVQIDTVSATRYLRFRGRTDRALPNVQCIEYRWQKDGGTVTLRSGAVVDTYQLERGTNATCPVPPANFVAASSNTVTDFRVTLRNADLVPIYSADPLALASTRRFDVKLKLVSVLERTEYDGPDATSGETELIDETRWERQIRPLNLQRENKVLQLQ